MSNKNLNFCRCSNCQTLDCPAGIELAEAKTQTATSDQRIRELRSYIDLLREQRDNAIAQEQRSRVECNRFRVELTAAQTERVEILADAEKILSERDHLFDEVERLKEEREKAIDLRIKKIRELSDKNDTLRAEVERLTERLKLMDTAENRRALGFTEDITANDEIANLHRVIDESQSEVEQLRLGNIELFKTNQERIDEIDTLNIEIERLKADRDTALAARKERDRAFKTCDALRAEVERLQREQSEANKTIDYMLERQAKAIALIDVAEQEVKTKYDALSRQCAEMADRLIEIDEVTRREDGQLYWLSNGEPLSKP